MISFSLDTGIIFRKILACEIKGKSMSISYNGLWKMLNDENMYKKDLAVKLNISSQLLLRWVMAKTFLRKSC